MQRSFEYRRQFLNKIFGNQILTGKKNVRFLYCCLDVIFCFLISINKVKNLSKDFKVKIYFCHTSYLTICFMFIGYARVSTTDQNPNLQEDALKNVGCERIYSDRIGGTIKERPGLNKVKEVLRKGDTLVVWRLDRLGRSLKDLIEWMTFLDKEGIALKSLNESIDTSTSTGKLVFHIFGALAEFERNLIKERTQAGLSAARARGKVGGRPCVLDEDKKHLVIRLYNEKQISVKKICEMMNISKPTLYSYVKTFSS